jgi:hypothetical protein
MGDSNGEQVLRLAAVGACLKGKLMNTRVRRDRIVLSYPGSVLVRVFIWEFFCNASIDRQMGRLDVRWQSLPLIKNPGVDEHGPLTEIYQRQSYCNVIRHNNGYRYCVMSCETKCTKMGKFGSAFCWSSSRMVPAVPSVAFKGLLLGNAHWYKKHTLVLPRVPRFIRRTKQDTPTFTPTEYMRKK